jgi:glycosyltransferase involved in cell wall biosynthesis
MDQIEAQLDGGTYRGHRPPVSVVILTYNEEANVADAIRSCAWSDDIHVLDSGSKDRTQEIARSMGARVHVNAFKSFGDQRNWAIDNIPCKHPWHFHLDADERFTPPVVREMLDQLGPDGQRSPHVCYLCPSKMIFLGRWIKRSAGYPNYQVRLFKYGSCRFMDFGHGQREVPQGSTGVLHEPYMHYAFSKGLNEWLNKHNAYSGREAEEGLLIRREGPPRLSAMLARDPTQRRRGFKNFAYFLRFRAVWRFIYNYVFRMGLLDGPAGFHYCMMISMYEYWIELKIREAQQRWVEHTDALVGDLMREDPPAALMPPTIGGPAPTGSAPSGPAPLEAAR